MTDLLELDLNNLDTVYDNDGALAEHIPGYIYREQQVTLANKIAQTIQNKKILLAEAGTGTGKTLAYLIPAILSNNKVIISTGTKNLQNQLFFRDLPLALKALGYPVKTSLLKGRANYLCKYRLELALTDLLLSSKDMVVQLKQVLTWAEATNDGDISTLADVPEDSEVWSYVTSTPDNCLAKDCPFISKCFVYKARQEALDSKIIVINHHLLLSDWGIKTEHVDARLLPDGVNLILDEAHQIPHIASSYFGVKVSSKQIKSLCQDIQNEQKLEIKDQPILSKQAKDVINLLDKLQNYTRELTSHSDANSERGYYRYLISDDIFKYDFNNLYDSISDLLELLRVNSDRSKGMSLCFERMQELQSNLAIFKNVNKVSTQGSSKVDNNILWYEIYKYSFMLKQSPLSIRELFIDKLHDVARSCVLTSATITVMDDFSLIQSDLGLQEAETIKISSPFDYYNKSLLYIPRGMPDPHADKYSDCYIEAVLPVIDACQGGVFLLFTSFNAMHMAYDKLHERLKNTNSDIELLMQGEASKTALVSRFAENTNNVLLATASFWEGVDVKGPALHCVVIDKLPFATPNDPILQSKINSLRKSGKNPFIDLQCQQAALQLVQGAGRLIRSETDYGVLMICDPRIISKTYGDIFLSTLPAMPRTRDIEKIRDFYKNNMI